MRYVLCYVQSYVLSSRQFKYNATCGRTLAWCEEKQTKYVLQYLYQNVCVSSRSLLFKISLPLQVNCFLDSYCWSRFLIIINTIVAEDVAATATAVAATTVATTAILCYFSSFIYFFLLFSFQNWLDFQVSKRGVDYVAMCIDQL